MAATVLKWGYRGGIMLLDLVGMRLLPVFLVAFVPVLIGALVAFELGVG